MRSSKVWRSPAVFINTKLKGAVTSSHGNVHINLCDCLGKDQSRRAVAAGALKAAERGGAEGSRGRAAGVILPSAMA